MYMYLCMYVCMYHVFIIPVCIQSNVLPCREVVNELQGKIGTKIFEAALSGKILESENFLNNEDRVKLKRCIFASQVYESVMCVYVYVSIINICLEIEFTYVYICI